MTDPDHYKTLGVSPNAEDIVVTAAYRALAQRYHPDRWKGDPEIAHQRMSEINVAYDVLGNKASRATYDKSRAGGHQESFRSDSESNDQEMFEEGIASFDQDWEIAATIYSDLKLLRQQLSLLSKQAEFQYVASLLASKLFQERRKLAAAIERDYLERYFGPDPFVAKFAKTLILAREKKAATYLNNLVNVMGSKVPSGLIIEKVEQKFLFFLTIETLDQLRLLSLRVKRNISVTHTLALIKSCGFKYEVSNSFFSGDTFKVHSPRGWHKEFPGERELIDWARKFFCPVVDDPEKVSRI
jgi:curved DNA-binding protein CbpA